MVTRCSTCGVGEGYAVQGCAECGPAVRVVERKPVQALGTALTVLLLATAAVTLLSLAAPIASVVTAVLMLACMVVTLVWLYRARQNVEGLGGQRRHRAWVFWGWICPVVFLWFPLQIVGDIARVDRPEDGAAGAALLRYAWWASWLLAWATSFQYVHVVTRVPGLGYTEGYQINFLFAGTTPSIIFATIAAILLAAVVRDISARQQTPDGRGLTAQSVRP